MLAVNGVRDFIGRIGIQIGSQACEVLGELALPGSADKSGAKNSELRHIFVSSKCLSNDELRVFNRPCVTPVGQQRYQR
jgi:hypothetical protein